MIIVRALNPGDIVRLRSGGHWMTVEKTDGTLVECSYFAVVDEDGTIFEPDLRRTTVPEVALIHIDDVEDEDHEES